MILPLKTGTMNLGSNSCNKENKTMPQERNQRKKQSYLLMVVGFLVALVMPMQTVRAADEASSVAFFCVPQSAEKKLSAGGIFTLDGGEKVSFSCGAKTTDAKAGFSAMLVGKQVDPQGALAGSGSSLTQESSNTTLEFPAVFQPGLYTYTFSLIDTKTKQPLAEDIVLTGKVEGGKEQPRILSVTLDKERYEWGMPAALTALLEVSNGDTPQSKGLTLAVSLQDKEGKMCRMLIDDQPIEVVQDTYQFTLPEAGACANTLEVVLKTKQGDKGMILDKKLVAFGVPEMKTFDGEGFTLPNGGFLAALPQSLLIGLVVTGGLFLVLIGYFLMKKKRRTY